MAKRLFIGGFPYSTTEDELKEMFSKIGELESVSIITDKYTGNSKGFGFIEYKKDEDAPKAIETLNNTELGGRRINVAEAKPMEKRDDRSGGGFNDRRGGFGNNRGGGFNDRRGGGRDSQRSDRY
ncbi:RNA-binding protein [Patescibacteria group bacterium]|nr:RNA-binding protein [Patescibacteria group bacterium]